MFYQRGHISGAERVLRSLFNSNSNYHLRINSSAANAELARLQDPVTRVRAMSTLELVVEEARAKRELAAQLIDAADRATRDADRVEAARAEEAARAPVRVARADAARDEAVAQAVANARAAKDAADQALPIAEADDARIRATEPAGNDRLAQLNAVRRRLEDVRRVAVEADRNVERTMFGNAAVDARNAARIAAEIAEEARVETVGAAEETRAVVAAMRGVAGRSARDANSAAARAQTAIAEATANPSNQAQAEATDAHIWALGARNVADADAARITELQAVAATTRDAAREATAVARAASANRDALDARYPFNPLSFPGFFGTW